MFTLTQSLLDAQRSASRTPFVGVSIVISESPYQDVRYFNGGRLLALEWLEQIWGGYASITLDNSDLTLSNQDFSGRRVEVTFGYVTSSGTEYVTRAPLWVTEQQHSSIEGKLVLILKCADLWSMLSMVRSVSDEASKPSPGYNLTGDNNSIYSIVRSILLDVRLSGFPNGIDVFNADVSLNDPFFTSYPQVIADWGTPARNIIRQVMGMTSVGLVVRSDRVRAVKINPNASPVYTYDATHLISQSLRQRTAIIPNVIIFAEREPTDPGEILNSISYATATHTDSVNRIGRFVELFYPQPGTKVTTPTLQQRADAILERLKAESVTGLFTTAANVGQELYDLVSVVDSRSGITYTGRVGAIRWKLSEGEFTQEIRLGGIAEELNLTPRGLVSDLVGLQPNVVLPAPTTPHDLIKVLQPSNMDIEFTPVSQTQVSWTAGTITFADGSSASIAAGSRTMTGATEYLYFQVGQPTLLATGLLSETQGINRTVIAALYRGITASDKVLIFPFKGRIHWNIDEFKDGSTYKRVKSIALTNDGLVALDSTVEGTYGKVKKASLNADGLVLLDQTVEGTYGKVKKSSLDASGLVLLDQTVEGTYGRVKKAGLTAEGLVLLDQTVEGTYGKVLAADISAGHIKLSATIQDPNNRTVTDSQKSTINDAASFFQTVITAQGIVSSMKSGSTSTRTEFTASGIRGLNNGNLQFELRSSDGRAVCGGGSVVLDSFGIALLADPGESQFFQVKDKSGTSTLGKIGRSGSGSFLIEAVGTLAMSCGGLVIFAGNGAFTLSTNTVYCDYNVLYARDILPSAATRKLGNILEYWASVYANTYYGKNTSIQSFDHYDDTEIVLSATPLSPRGPLDMSKFPVEVYDPATGFVNIPALLGLMLCVLRDNTRSINSHNSRLAALESTK